MTPPQCPHCPHDRNQLLRRIAAGLRQIDPDAMTVHELDALAGLVEGRVGKRRCGVRRRPFQIV